MPPPLDAIQKNIGPYGRYQFKLTLIIFTAKVSIAFYMIAIVFLAPKVSYTCPDAVDSDQKTPVCPCEKPVYDKSLFKSTIIMEWNLICDKKWLISFTQMIFQFGTLVGSLLFGTASDRYGRKKPLLGAVVLQLGAAIGAIYAPDYWSFTILRFLVGVAVGGTMVTSFVLLMEFIGAQHRTVIASLYQLPFNLGHTLLPLIAYLLRDNENFYRDYQWALSVSAFVLLPYFFVLPETARWLLAVKRTDEAIQVIEKVARVNNLPTDNIRRDIEAYQRQLDQQRHFKKGTILDLFRTPNIRRNIICMATNWVSCSYCFYGLAQYVSHLTGNIFINVFISASFAGMGTLLSIPLMTIMGRKTILITQNFIAAGCLLLLCVTTNYPILSVVLATIGVMASFIVFVVVYLYCGELFPTVVRNAAVGFSSMMARVGSMVAPFVVGTKDIAEWVPPLLFAIVPLIAGLLAFLMPETKGRELMTTLEEAEQFRNEPRST